MAQTFHVYDMQPGLTQVKLSSKFFIQAAQLLIDSTLRSIKTAAGGTDAGLLDYL